MAYFQPAESPWAALGQGMRGIAEVVAQMPLLQARAKETQARIQLYGEQAAHMRTQRLQEEADKIRTAAIWKDAEPGMMEFVSGQPVSPMNLLPVTRALTLGLQKNPEQAAKNLAAINAMASGDPSKMAMALGIHTPSGGDVSAFARGMADLAGLGYKPGDPEFDSMRQFYDQARGLPGRSQWQGPPMLLPGQTQPAPVQGPPLPPPSTLPEALGTVPTAGPTLPPVFKKWVRERPGGKLIPYKEIMKPKLGDTGTNLIDRFNIMP